MKTANSKKSLETLWKDELADMYDVEKRLVRALPKMAKAVSSEELKEAIQKHLEETQGHVEKLEQVFADCEMKPRAKKCEAMVGILTEGDEIVAEYQGSQAIDAAVICASQKVEHYEIASYGCLHEWSALLGMDEAAAVFEEILGEERACDETLTEIARTIANEEAEEGDDEEEVEDEEEDEDEE